MDFITSIVIPLIVLAGMIYVVAHQYGELKGRHLARKDAKDAYLNNKLKTRNESMKDKSDKKSINISNSVS